MDSTSSTAAIAAVGVQKLTESISELHRARSYQLILLSIEKAKSGSITHTEEHRDLREKSQVGEKAWRE